jgi:type II secretory pathway component PulK
METKRVTLQKQSVSPSADNTAGSILLIALWSICLLSTFAVILGYGVRQKLVLANRLQERDKLFLISEAGLRRAAAELKKLPPKDYDILSAPWADNLAAFKDVSVGDGTVNICYNYINEQSGAKILRYGLIDEERKININKAERLVLNRLFLALGYGETRAQELAASIVDWRDADSELSIPSGSAESSYYRGLPEPYDAKNAEFEVLDEVLLVKGIDESVFDSIKDYITIYGGGKVNINTASGPVLFALGLSEAIVGDVLAFRAGEDGASGTSDDNFFDSTANIVPKLSQAYHLNDPEIAQLNSVQPQLTVNSENFMARCSLKLQNSKSTSEAVGVINRESGSTLYWQGL